MDTPQEAVDETTESVNPLDQSASGSYDSTSNEYASTEANDSKFLGKRYQVTRESSVSQY